MATQVFTVPAEPARPTLCAFLRAHLPGRSWTQVRRLIAARRARLNGELCLDPARRLREGDTVEFLARSAPKPRQPENIRIRYLDEHLVVVEKPAGLPTVRHPLERAWNERRKALTPTLEDLVPRLIAQQEGQRSKGPLPRLRVVHRLDKETSGLVVFARTVQAQVGLGRQFHAHSVMRRYLALVPGYVKPQRVATRLVRDRGDGRRGSTSVPGAGKEAITHIEVEERLPRYTLLACRLETGRTHQIRIHLAELGHPVCGEKVYNRRPHGPPGPDPSGAPRLALHAVELGFVHPVTGESLHWTMPLPPDLQAFLDRLRARAPTPAAGQAANHNKPTRLARPPRPAGSNPRSRQPTMEIKWTDTDPETGQRRFLCAERFAGVWRFRWKFQRRGDWNRGLEPTRAMWEHVLDSLRRRYRRREGVSDEDVEQVERILKAWREPADEEE